MSVFIKLTALKRNNLPFTKQILVDVNKIVTPIIENELSQSIIEVNTDVSYSESFFENREKYVVAEDLDAIDLLTDEVFKGTIVSQNGRPSFWPEALFVKSKIVGTVKEAVGDASEFDYKLMATKSPETFIVSEDIDTVNS